MEADEKRTRLEAELAEARAALGVAKDAHGTMLEYQRDIDLMGSDHSTDEQRSRMAYGIGIRAAERDHYEALIQDLERRLSELDE